MLLRDLFNTPPERVTKRELYLMSSGSAPWALRRLIDNPESALPNGEAYQGHGYNKTQCSKKWRITNADVIGDHWVMSELTFYSDSACNQSLATYIDTKRGDYEGTIVDRPGEACMAANPDQLRDGVYDSQSGCCRQPCTASSTKWLGLAARLRVLRHRAARGWATSSSWTCRSRALRLVLCTLRISMFSTSSFRGTISASGTFTPASSTLERSIRATR